METKKLIDRMIKVYGKSDKIRTYEAIKGYLNGEQLTTDEWEQGIKYAVKQLGL